MTQDKNSSGLGGTLGIVGVGVAMVACCAGPALITGGVLGTVGGVLRSPWLIAAGVLAVLAAALYTARRRAAHRSSPSTAPADCCPPTPPRHDLDARERSDPERSGGPTAHESEHRR